MMGAPPPMLAPHFHVRLGSGEAGPGEGARNLAGAVLARRLQAGWTRVCGVGEAVSLVTV